MGSTWKGARFSLSASGPAVLSPASSVAGQSGRDREAPWSTAGLRMTSPLPSLLKSRDRTEPFEKP